jgi:phage terminase large subunit-like protein
MTRCGCCRRCVSTSGGRGVRWRRVGSVRTRLPCWCRGPRLYWLELPKGSSKSTDAAAMSIVWLLSQARPGDEGYVVSSDEDQSNRLLNRARVIIRGSSSLQSAIRVQARSIVNVKTGTYVEALAADVSSSEGLLSPWMLVDELPRWKSTQGARDLWTSIFSGFGKVAGARLVVLGHAGDPAHWSYRIRERARTSAVTIAGPCPWMDPVSLEEQRALLLPSQFAQRHLNRWTAGEDRLASRDDVAACVGSHEVLSPRPHTRYVIGLDVGLTDDRTAATVAHRQGERVVVDRQQVWAGTRADPVSLDGVEAWLLTASRDYNNARVWADPYQAVHLCQRLREAHVRVREFPFSSQSVGRLAVTLFRLVKGHLLVLPDDTGLVDELANARLRETSPGVFRIDHDAGRHDDRVVSLALACEQLVSRPVPRGTDLRRAVETLARADVSAGPIGGSVFSPRPRVVVTDLDQAAVAVSGQQAVRVPPGVALVRER